MRLPAFLPHSVSSFLSENVAKHAVWEQPSAFIFIQFLFFFSLLFMQLKNLLLLIEIFFGHYDDKSMEI